jgi:hypothetical protein
MQTSKLLENNLAYTKAVAFISEQQSRAQQSMRDTDELSFCMALSVKLATLQILYVCRVDEIIFTPLFARDTKLPHDLTIRDMCLILLASEQFTFNRYSGICAYMDKDFFGQLWDLVGNASKEFPAPAVKSPELTTTQAFTFAAHPKDVPTANTSPLRNSKLFFTSKVDNDGPFKSVAPASFAAPPAQFTFGVPPPPAPTFSFAERKPKIDVNDGFKRDLIKQCIGDRNKCGLTVVDMFYDEISKRNERRQMSVPEPLAYVKFEGGCKSKSSELSMLEE